MRNVVDLFGRMGDLVPSIPGETIARRSPRRPAQLVYALATYIRMASDQQSC